LYIPSPWQEKKLGIGVLISAFPLYLFVSLFVFSGNVGLDNTELVEKLNSAVQQLLQQHVTTTRPDDVMHYSRILMLLPTLYGINCRMVENLFCKRINTDMQVLLKEMLQNL
jgi:hypothetical protein